MFVSDDEDLLYQLQRAQNHHSLITGKWDFYFTANTSPTMPIPPLEPGLDVPAPDVRRNMTPEEEDLVSDDDDDEHDVLEEVFEEEAHLDDVEEQLDARPVTPTSDAGDIEENIAQAAKHEDDLKEETVDLHTLHLATPPRPRRYTTSTSFSSTVPSTRESPTQSSLSSPHHNLATPSRVRPPHPSHVPNPVTPLRSILRHTPAPVSATRVRIRLPSRSPSPTDIFHNEQHNDIATPRQSRTSIGQDYCSEVGWGYDGATKTDAAEMCSSELQDTWKYTAGVMDTLVNALQRERPQTELRPRQSFAVPSGLFYAAELAIAVPRDSDAYRAQKSNLIHSEIAKVSLCHCHQEVLWLTMP